MLIFTRILKWMQDTFSKQLKQCWILSLKNELKLHELSVDTFEPSRGKTNNVVSEQV